MATTWKVITIRTMILDMNAANAILNNRNHYEQLHIVKVNPIAKERFC